MKPVFGISLVLSCLVGLIYTVSTGDALVDCPPLLESIQNHEDYEGYLKCYKLLKEISNSTDSKLSLAVEAIRAIESYDLKHDILEQFERIMDYCDQK